MAEGGSRQAGEMLDSKKVQLGSPQADQYMDSTRDDQASAHSILGATLKQMKESSEDVS